MLLHVKFWAKMTCHRSVSAVTPSKKSSVITNSQSTKDFPISLRLTEYVASKPPKRAQNAK